MNEKFIERPFHLNEYLIKVPLMHFLHFTWGDALLEKNFARIRKYLADKTCPSRWILFIKNVYLMPIPIVTLLWQLFQRESSNLEFLEKRMNYSLL